MITLTVKQGPMAGKRFEIPPSGKAILGRSSVCDVAIVDFKLSRVHCQIEFTETGAVLEDLGSRNGTYLNGNRIAARLPLSPGDEITIGDSVITFDQTEDDRAGLEEIAPRGQTTFIKRRQSCARCNAIIPRRDLTNGSAKMINGHPVCARCLDPLIDSEFSGYRILRKLGAGAMGSVYEATRNSDGTPVALKFLAKSVTSNPEAVKRFLREAVSGGQLDHPNVVKSFESGVDIDKGIYYLAMEYVEGTNARNLISEKGRLDPKLSWLIGIQIASALEAAFKAKVIHRDIKPANILVGSTGQAKLVDLGTAKSLQTAGLSSLTKTGIGMGTVAYMPPEQIEDAKHADHRSDQYSLGASIFHMITGQRPFSGKTPGEYFRAIRFEPVKWPQSPSIPASVRNVIEKMMEKDPAKRFQKPSEMVAAMEKALGSLQ